MSRPMAVVGLPAAGQVTPSYTAAETAALSGEHVTQVAVTPAPSEVRTWKDAVLLYFAVGF